MHDTDTALDEQAARLSDEMRLVAHELSAIIVNLHAPIPKVHSGLDFLEVIGAYISSISDLRMRMRPVIDLLASKVTSLAGREWVERKDVILLWHQLAETIVGQLGDHPDTRKNVGAILLTADNVCLSYAANALPNGLPVYEDFFVKGQRKNNIVCAEANALSLPLDVKVHSSIAPHSSHAEKLTMNKRDVQRFKNLILDRAVNAPKLDGHFLVVSVLPCLQCARMITAHGIRGVIVRRKPREVKFSREMTNKHAKRELARTRGLKGKRAKTGVLYVRKRGITAASWPYKIG